ncbi:hypothetical protein EVAR_54596_1 [Eumeta japonica]|uniref:Uncharacterized protein n=1 Tax=Eumeta variegata TaxID=151549 RepID=A0A4C1YQJ8_EUMVA|nr:hypothetical protein EVAR_54596_1 [Eumeta japonica]
MDNNKAPGFDLIVKKVLEEFATCFPRGPPEFETADYGYPQLVLCVILIVLLAIITITSFINCKVFKWSISPEAAGKHTRVLTAGELPCGGFLKGVFSAQGSHWDTNTGWVHSTSRRRNGLDHRGYDLDV